ncbi:NAD-dependent epimerase/dehydratase family protein [Shewanella corallii]|uniref:NAD-dependent epimerase/dehydratase family protein n=1 Tax=Shewanella corallii TaxID=560080 RepID=A0ABT0N5X2_9GAMM|nr:NAD-dependent epimerase/dehydratase family protein [Shewanella corallii]MCL2913222.1 NAD-dependent epimerase/dehydratase family protein [Shewanella corallii]
MGAEALAKSLDGVALASEETQVLQQIATAVDKVLVTGGGGFLGLALCRRLYAAGIEVVSLSRSQHASLDELGIEQISASLTDIDAVKAACEGCQLVFHVAAKAGVWGAEREYFETNVDGTANIIAACQQAGVTNLVYTSTPSVTFAGHDEEGIDESTPHAERYLNAYGRTKSLAEKMVLSAQGAEVKGGQRLTVVALRPHLIWGPGDPHLVPRVLERGRQGRLRLLGDKDKLVDTIYVDNAAWAHLLAAKTLLQQPEKAAGKAYFLSNDEPMPMAEVLNRILACDGLPGVSKRVNSTFAYWVGAAMEVFYTLLGISAEPPMTRFVARQLSCSHFYRLDAAKSDLGYRPLVSVDEGMQRLKSSLKK